MAERVQMGAGMFAKIAELTQHAPSHVYAASWFGTIIYKGFNLIQPQMTTLSRSPPHPGAGIAIRTHTRG